MYTPFLISIFHSHGFVYVFLNFQIDKSIRASPSIESKQSIILNEGYFFFSKNLRPSHIWVTKKKFYPMKCLRKQETENDSMNFFALVPVIDLRFSLFSGAFFFLSSFSRCRRPFHRGIFFSKRCLHKLQNF